MSDKIEVKKILGTQRMYQDVRYNEDGKLSFYFYSIFYDRDGKEVSRTEPVQMGSITVGYA